MDRRKGVRVRSGSSIEIDFIYRGQRCRETLKGLAPTKANLLHATRKREAILMEIGLGTFDYLKYFPDSKLADRFGHGRNLSVGQALDAFLQSSRRTCENSTWRNYRSAVEHHLRPTFGQKLMRDVATSDIKESIGGLAITNKRINNVLIPLRAIFADAFADGVIDRNPLDRIQNLSNRMEEPDPFTPDEIGSVLAAMEDQTRNLFAFAFWTGLRTSELLAVEWGDIDFRATLARIRRASVGKITKSPKTQSGERDVLLLRPALDALAAQKPHSFLAGHTVFLNPRTGKAWETDGQLRKTAWIPALRKAGVRYRNPYQTRHTYASMMLTAGENPMWVAKQMGHKDWGMIRKRYGRYIPAVDAQAGSRATAFLSQIGHKGQASA